MTKYTELFMYLIEPNKDCVSNPVPSSAIIPDEVYIFLIQTYQFIIANAILPNFASSANT